MDAGQQTALQTLAGRALTASEVTLATNRQDADLAASLSVGLTKTVPTQIGIGSILATLGPEAGAAFLDAMEALAPTCSPVKWAMVLVNAATLDVGSPATIAMVNLLVSGGTSGGITVAANTIPQSTATALLALAQQPAPITTDQVSAILNNGAL